MASREEMRKEIKMSSMDKEKENVI